MPLTSRQWMHRLGGVGVLGASIVAAAAISGDPMLRVGMLAIAALAFVIGYVVAPAMRPFAFATALAIVLAVAVASLGAPLLPTLAIALCVGWIVARRLAVMQGILDGQARCLERVREGALSDAAGHRRGLESMATKLAHELKNPLAAMKSLVQVELAHAKDDKSRRRLDVALGETERIDTIIREYLNLARPMLDAQVSGIDLAELMSDVRTLLAGRAHAAGVELTVGGRGGLMHADPRLLKEAIVNLTSNAIEATPRGGAVNVTYDHDREVRIVIRDTGMGMSKEVSNRVGMPFFTTREGGTGLGVAIARAAIAQHRGKLEYASEPGMGTTATIALPLDPRSNDRACL
jgi:signal transduction histidine kinase